LTWRRVLGYLRYFQQEGVRTSSLSPVGEHSLVTDPAFWLSIATAFLPLAPTSALVCFVAAR
jgi:hypothetical protein